MVVIRSSACHKPFSQSFMPKELTDFPRSGLKTSAMTWIGAKCSSGYAGPSMDLNFLDVLLTTSHADREKWRFQSHHSVCKAYCLYERKRQETMIILAKTLLIMGILLPWLRPTTIMYTFVLKYVVCNIPSSLRP